MTFYNFVNMFLAFGTICSLLHINHGLHCVSARSSELRNILDGIKCCSGNQKSDSDFRCMAIALYFDLRGVLETYCVIVAGKLVT